MALLVDQTELERLLAIARQAQRRASWLGDAVVASLDVADGLDALVVGLATLLGEPAQPRLADRDVQTETVEPDPSELCDPVTVIPVQRLRRIDAAIGSDDEVTQVLRRPSRKGTP